MINEYIEARGWTKFGRCSCKPPLDKFSNPTYPSHEIRVSLDGKTMQVRLGGSVVNRAGMLNFQEIFDGLFQ